MDETKLKIEFVPLDSIKPYPRNAKLHPAEQIEQIKESIRRVGFRDPIGIWHGEIVEGHGRYLAAQELGMERVPVIRLDDMTDEQRRAYMLIHNQTTMNSGWDFSLLEQELESFEMGMSAFGFDAISFAEYPDDGELDADDDGDDAVVVRLVFDSYKNYSVHERAVKEFVSGIGVSVTVGK